jgi:hypothetical protein
MSYFESLLSQSGIAIAPAQVQVPAASKEAPPVEPIEVEAFRELGPDGRPLPGDAPPALPGAPVGSHESFEPVSEVGGRTPRQAPSTDLSAPYRAFGSEAAPPEPPLVAPRPEGAAHDRPRTQPAPGLETRDQEPGAEQVGRAAVPPPVEESHRGETESPTTDSRALEPDANRAPAPRPEADLEALGPRTLAQVRTWVAATPAPGEISDLAPEPISSTTVEAASELEPAGIAPLALAPQREPEPRFPPASPNVNLTIGAIELIVEAPPVPAPSPQPPQRPQARAGGGAGFRLRRHYLRS